MKTATQTSTLKAEDFSLHAEIHLLMELPKPAPWRRQRWLNRQEVGRRRLPMFTVETSEFVYLMFLTVLRLGAPILIFVLLAALARRVQTLQP